MAQIDVSQWRPFVIGDYFTLTKGKRLTRADMIPGKYRFIGASGINNGVTAEVANDEFLHEPHCLTLSYNGSVGEAFYQDEPFVASDDVNVIRAKQTTMTKEAYLFVAAVLKVIGQRYAFIDKWTIDRMETDEIVLPATRDGEPDWEYMTEFMAGILLTAEDRLRQLSTLITDN